MKLWMFTAILLCGATVLLFSCSKDDSSYDDNIPSNIEAEYGVIVYGNVGGDMDHIIDNYFYDAVAPLLTDPSKVRVGVCYKYGKDDGNNKYSGKYAQSGDVVMFELSSKTPLYENSLGENYGVQWPEMAMYDESTLTNVINHFKQNMPAKKYVLLLYGHGGGWDAQNDYEREAQESGASGSAATRGVLYDEWTQSKIGSNALSMYELHRAVEKSQIKHFDGIFFHNCFSGNMESLADMYTVADYTISSMHSLVSNCESMVSLVKVLQKGEDFKTSAINAFQDFKEQAEQSYSSYNGDFNLLENKEIPNLFPICQQLGSRLQTIYTDKKTEIDNAIENDVYVTDQDFYFIDLQYYADKMAEVTGDAELKTIATNLRTQMDKTILASLNFYNSPCGKGIKPKFTLSVVDFNKAAYNSKGKLTYSIKTAYEYTNFHKQTKWGDWLNTVEKRPTKNNPAGMKSTKTDN